MREGNLARGRRPFGMEPTAPSVPSWDGFAVPDLPVAAAAADFELLAGVVRDDYSLAGQDTETGWSALHYAAWPLGARSIWAGGRERDRREVLMELCDQSGPSDLDAKDERGRTALHLAAMSNNAAAIKVLCGEANASTACRDEDGNTPLLLAVRLQHVAAVSALVDQGADLCAPDTADGSTALMWACGEAAGRAEVVRALLRSHEVGLNQTQGDGCTALHIAVKQGTEEIVRLLIDAGADPQIVNHRWVGGTARRRRAAVPLLTPARLAAHHAGACGRRIKRACRQSVATFAARGREAVPAGGRRRRSAAPARNPWRRRRLLLRSGWRAGSECATTATCSGTVAPT